MRKNIGTDAKSMVTKIEIDDQIEEKSESAKNSKKRSHISKCDKDSKNISKGKL
jgi:hypothetical protein